MMKKFKDINEATIAWTEGFNEIPYALFELAYGGNDYEGITDLTPLSKGVKVSFYCCDRGTLVGEIDEFNPDSNTATVIVDGVSEEQVFLDELTLHRSDFLPQAGVWTFSNTLDEEWATSEKGLQAMADCGFCVFESDELGIFFGIDGGGYCFLNEHFIPLYKERGLLWHKIAVQANCIQAVQVFINNFYVRDMQIYLGKEDEVYNDDDEYWRDGSGDVLLATIGGTSDIELVVAEVAKNYGCPPERLSGQAVLIQA